MSVSIDNGPGEEKEDSRQVLSVWLDDYIAGRCDRAKMHESFLAVCRSNPEAPWDALALLDQYQRRGRVDIGLARSLKTEIAQLVFGVPNQTEEPHDTEATLDTTGSRWRKLYAERGSINADEPPPEQPEERSVLRRDFEPTRRDFDPLTRPPQMARTPPKPAEPEQRPAEIGVGTVLRERYELMEVIRSDAAGTLYQAFDRHRSHLPAPSCYVAVRVLPQTSDARVLAEMERAAYEAQSLSHPNIVSVFDLDRHQNVYFVVMELLEGELLSDVILRLNGKPMSRERALAVIGAVGSALAHAHQRNLVHGDLKPASIVLTTDGDIKVLDFGFARSHELHDQDGREPSVDGVDPRATAAYASAERVSGAAPHPRDDVYSLACIAYELLSGRQPYGGRSGAIARAQGRAPSKVPGLSLRQWNALQTALQPSREERRIDVSGLLVALDCAESAQHGLAMTASAAPLDNPFGRGKGVALAVLFVLIAAGLAWWQLPRFIQPEDVSPVATTASPASEPGTTIGEAPPAEPAADAASLPPTPSQSTDTPPPDLSAPQRPGAIVAATADPEPATPQAAAPAAERSEPTAASAAGAASPSESPAAARRVSVEFDKDTYVATESDGMVKLTVRRNGSTRGAARFRWSLRANSAEPGTDYAAIGPDIEEIPSGSRTVTITIPLVMDTIPENTELFLVELEAVDGGPEIGSQAHAAVIIVDDD
jgi:serine/threonine protein kinase